MKHANIGINYWTKIVKFKSFKYLCGWKLAFLEIWFYGNWLSSRNGSWLSYVNWLSTGNEFLIKTDFLTETSFFSRDGNWRQWNMSFEIRKLSFEICSWIQIICIHNQDIVFKIKAGNSIKIYHFKLKV